MGLPLRIYYHPKQHECLFGGAKHKIISKGRRFGITNGLANFISEKILEGVYRKVLWGDVTLGNTKKYWERYFMPIWKQIPRDLWGYHKQENSFQYKDSYIDFRGADYPENWEGFGYDLVVLNEAGIILKNEYLYYNAVMPMMLDFDADSIIAGTPKGKRGVFFSLAQTAKDELEPDYQYFQFSSYDNPMIAKESIDKMAVKMPEVIRRQEIYGEFIDDTGSVFRNIEECATSLPSEPKDDETYYIGLDLAKHEDFSVIKIINSKKEEVYTDRFNQLEWAIQKEKICNISKIYNNARVLLDATGLGDVILEDLQMVGLDVEGLKFTNESKFNLIKNLILGFETRKIKIINDPVTIGELKNFEYTITSTSKVKYEARNGHDDTVIALALAYYQIRDMDVPTMRFIEPKGGALLPNYNPRQWRKIS